MRGSARRVSIRNMAILAQNGTLRPLAVAGNAEIVELFFAPFPLVASRAFFYPVIIALFMMTGKAVDARTLMFAVGKLYRAYIIRRFHNSSPQIGLRNIMINIPNHGYISRACIDVNQAVSATDEKTDHRSERQTSKTIELSLFSLHPTTSFY